MLVRNASPVCAESLREAGIEFESLDFVYEKSRNFDTLTRNLAAEIAKRAEGVSLCYCVEGGVTEDRTAELLRRGREICVIEGVSKAASAAARAGLCGSYTAVSAYEAGTRKTLLPLVIYDLTDRELASDVKLLLAERFGDEAPACYICGGTVRKIALYEADRQEEYGGGAALVVYDTPLLEKKRFDLEDFLAILRRLRTPDGCPWDRVQTHESIRLNGVEEMYELVDAIDSGDPEKMCEEAGDVLMQAAFHTLIEEEKGNFTMTDVLSEVCEKLITRHTHVFGKEKASGAEGALSVWDRNKMTEKHQTTFSDAVNDVPLCFPALLRAQKICKRTEKGGWKFSDEESAEQRIRSAVAEVRRLHAAGRVVSPALGEALLGMAWLGRATDAECEQALADAAKRMQREYTAFEARVRADGKDVNALTEAEFLQYYKTEKGDVEPS